MNIIEESIVIDRPRSEVFAFFADPDNVPLYSSNVSEYTVTSGGTTEVGRKAQAVVRVAGVRLEFTDELVEFEDGAKVVLESKDGKVPYTMRVTFEDEGTGTKVTHHQEAEEGTGVFKLADKLVTKMYARDVRGNLENAKAMLEDS